MNKQQEGFSAEAEEEELLENDHVENAIKRGRIRAAKQEFESLWRSVGHSKRESKVTFMQKVLRVFAFQAVSPVYAGEGIPQLIRSKVGGQSGKNACLLLVPEQFGEWAIEATPQPDMLVLDLILPEPMLGKKFDVWVAAGKGVDEQLGRTVEPDDENRIMLTHIDYVKKETTSTPSALTYELNSPSELEALYKAENVLAVILVVEAT